MDLRTRAVVVASLALLAFAYERRVEARPAPPGEVASAAPGPGEPPPRDARRGDRHARAAARRRTQVHRVDGRIARTGDRLVAIRSGGGAEVALRVAPGTAVTLGGLPAAPEALSRGADVSASYRSGGGGPPTAIRIDARAPEPPPEPASPRGPAAEEPPGSYGG